MPRPKEVSLIDIAEYIDFRPYEVCGFVRKDKYYLTNRGIKNQCQWSRSYPVLWHTHYDGRPFWPSVQDLMKPLERVRTSIVFTSFERPNKDTRYLKWTISCPSRYYISTINLSELKKDLRLYMRHYFHDKQRGVRVVKDTNKKVYRVSRQRGTNTINSFVARVNRLVQEYAPLYKLKVRNMEF